MPVKKKAPAKKKPVVLKKPPDLTKTDMQLYYRLTNWEEMWREFYLAINPDASKRYRTVRMFATAMKESDEQFDFLMWYLGPYDKADHRNKKYEFAGEPLDFYKKRESGGWFTEEALKVISKSVRMGTNALAQIQEAGNDSALLQIYRIERLKQQLDKDFQGQLMIEGLTMKENADRVNLYLTTHNRLDSLAKSAIEQFALTRGINYADLGGYAQLMAGLSISINQFANNNGNTVTTEKTEVEKCIADMVKMTMAKGKMFDLPVPAGLEPQTIDITPEKPADSDKKKKPN